MGFSQIASGLTGLQSAATTRSSAKSVLMQSKSNAQMMQNRAKGTLNTSLHNSHLIRNDGQREVGREQARVGASNVASMSGSAMVSDTDLATRLEQNIRDNAHKAMEESRQLEYQANMELWRGNNEYKNLKRSARSQAINGVINIAGGIMSGGGSNTTTTEKSASAPRESGGRS